MHLLPLARLLRLPNVFNAFADIALGLCATAALSPQSLDASFPWKAALLLLASGCLYTAGMVWNDYFDLEEDKRDRPFRPIPTGKVTLRAAALLGGLLLLVGVLLAGLAGASGDGYRAAPVIVA